MQTARRNHPALSSTANPLSHGVLTNPINKMAELIIQIISTI